MSIFALFFRMCTLPELDNGFHYGSQVSGLKVYGLAAIKMFNYFPFKAKVFVCKAYVLLSLKSLQQQVCSYPQMNILLL